MKKHVNIPLFIPHMGCPNQCVFCNQHTISGTCSFHADRVKEQIEAALCTILPETTCEIAFFGGSFTGIDRKLMIELLDTAQLYVDRGQVAGIRMSTRPDYIGEDVLQILSRYQILAVELGIQSMDDGVLSVCKRGHTAEDTRRACAMLVGAGIPWVGQMMIGLPGASSETEVKCAKEICSMGAAACRIYPTIVLQDTMLASWAKDGCYVPLTVDEAVERSCLALDVFQKNHVPCLRIGLCDSEMLHDPQVCLAGPVHPAMGELVGSRLYRNKMEKQMQKLLADTETLSGIELIVEVPLGDTSQVIGQKRQNILYLEKKYPVKFRKFIEKTDQMRYNIQLGICR